MAKPLKDKTHDLGTINVEDILGTTVKGTKKSDILTLDIRSQDGTDPLHTTTLKGGKGDDALTLRLTQSQLAALTAETNLTLDANNNITGAALDIFSGKHLTTLTSIDLTVKSWQTVHIEVYPDPPPSWTNGDFSGVGQSIDLNLAAHTLEFEENTPPRTDVFGSTDATAYFDGGTAISGFNFLPNLYVGTAFSDQMIADPNGSWLNGGGGGDTISGGTGDDILNGGAGNDGIGGGSGNDTIYGEGGNDTLVGHGGNDTIYGGDGDDLIVGFEGNDHIEGGEGRDVLIGDDGDAALGDDALFGGGGIDTIYGYAGNDTIDGGAGDDDITGGKGADAINGGDGFDTASYVNTNEAITVSLAPGVVGVGGEAEGDTFTSIEFLLGSRSNDTLTGNIDDNTLFGVEGNDVINGDAGNDHLDGGLGDDTLNGGTGNDTLYGGIGEDTLQGGTGRDNLTGAEGADAMDGGDGLDTVSYLNSTAAVTVSLVAGVVGIGGDAQGDTLINIEVLNGSAFNDTLTGRNDGSIIYGQNGDDLINGGDGGDTLDGGTGEDTLRGGSGWDDLHVGVDLDADTIIFNQNDAVAGVEDQIYEFNPTQDRVLIESTYSGTSLLDVNINDLGGGEYTAIITADFGSGPSTIDIAFHGVTGDSLTQSNFALWFV